MNKATKAFAASVAGLAIGLTGLSASAQVRPAAVAHPCYAKAVYGNGPGSGIWAKNYRAYDAWCNDAGDPGSWFGPWRLKKSSAQADAAQHNARVD